MGWKMDLATLDRLNYISEWVFQLIYLNILWVIFTIVGGVVFGIAPASAALCAVIRKKIRTADTFSIAKYFWQQYKASFIDTNIIFYMFLIMGFALNFYRLMLHQKSPALSALLFGTILCFIVAASLFFPIYNHFELKRLAYLKLAFLLTFFKLKQTIILVIALGVLALVCYLVPAIGMICGVSLYGLILTYFGNNLLVEMEQLKKSETVTVGDKTAV